jgi:glycosyltransferase involved in cell wall biosynthesis
MKTNNKKEVVSVVLPVYNAARYLEDSIQSIIDQSYKHWELIIVDDNSIDNSFEIAEKYARKDKRIKVFRNKSHKGVAITANRAINFAKGEFIARMDADDVSSKNRLSKQLSFLKKNSETILVGSQCVLIDANGKKIGKKVFPLNSKEIYGMLMNRLPVQQPSTMINRSMLPSDFVFYPRNFESGEEHQLLFRLFKYGEVNNLPDFLLKYRLHGKNISLQYPKRDFYRIFYSRMLAIFSGYKPSLSGIFINFFQLFIITLLPNKYIYPIFYFVNDFLRNIKSNGFIQVNTAKINYNNN